MGTILFAEDDDAMRAMVRDVLIAAGHEVQTATDGRAALDALAEADTEHPDLVVLDYRMGDIDGLQVCRRIKEDPRTEHLPVLILTGEGEIEDRIEGFAAGADDYLAKPFDPRELRARVDALLRLSERGRGLNPTTGLPGGAPIEREYQKRCRGSQPFTLVYLDLDYFKPFNDRFGFPLADSVIATVGRILRRSVAGTPHFAGHIGGDDFIVIADRGVARPLVNRIQGAFDDSLAALLPPDVAERGVYRGTRRSGEEGDIPVTRLTAALLHVDPENAPTLIELGEWAATAKQRAKSARDEGLIEIELGNEQEGAVAGERDGQPSGADDSRPSRISRNS